MPLTSGRCILKVCNVSTSRRPVYGEAVPDIPFASEDIVNRITDWRVSEDHTASNSQAILSRINLLRGILQMRLTRLLSSD